VEEHQRKGGLGGAVAEYLAQKRPTKQAFIGVDEKFGQSGTPDELLREYGMDKESIVSAARGII
jgi:transketolase